MTSASQVRRSGRSQQKPEGALRDQSTDSSDSEDAEDFVLQDPETKKGKTGRAPAPKRQPRKRKPQAGQQAKASDVDPQPVIAVAIDDLIGRVEKDCKRFVKDILTSHLDNTTEAQSAVVILLNLVAQYAGRPTDDTWTVDDYPSQTVEELAAAAMASIDAGGIDHFKLTGRSGKPRPPTDRMRARKKAEQFWLMLGQTAHDQGVDALELFEPVLDLSFMLSQSLVWCTRYAAVTTGLSIMTAIIELVLRAEERRSMLERQLKAAERARSRGRASDASAGTPGKSTRSQSQGDPKTASLRRERDREHDAISAATKRLCALFDCTVVTRCRDVMAAVRLDVVVAVGEWTVMYPSLFMKDAYLKYIAWGMSDKDPGVRKAAIEAVAAMVQDEEDALALEAFLGHFRGRIVETGSDREAPVCLAALHLLHLLLQHGLVSLQQLLPVMRWLHIDTAAADKQTAAVVHGAADLLVAALQATADKIHSESQQAQKRGGGRRRGSGSGGHASAGGGEDAEQLALLTALRDFFRLVAGDVPQVAHEPLDHETMKVLVQHLQPQLPVLRDWKVLAACLSADARDGLERVHLQDLAALLAASVEVEVASHDAADAAADAEGGGGADGAGAGRGRRGRQKAEEGGDVRQEVSLVLMDVMPGLLRSFANDPHVVKELLGILRHLDYAVYVAHSHHAAFADLLDDVAGLFERSQDGAALAAAAAALAHCAQLPQLQLCETAAQTAAVLRSKAVEQLDECAERLSTVTDAAMKKGVAALADGGSASAADDAGVAYVYALRGAVARVGRLAMQQAWNADLSADGRVRASLHDVLAARLAGRPLPAQIVTEALHALLFLCIADVQRVHRMLGRGGVRAGMSQVGVETEIAEVAASARSLMEQLLELLAVPGAAASDTVGAADVATLQYEACVTLIDVIALCNARRADDVPALEALAVDVTDDTADALWGCSNALLDAKAECCQEIDSLREGLESGGIADMEQEAAQAQLQAAEGQDSRLLERCLQVGCGLVRVVLNGALGSHAVRISGCLMAHCPLLDDHLNSIISQFIMRLKVVMPHMLPQALVFALTEIFEELCQLDESRYGMEDFEEIARALAKPLCEFGTSQALLLAVWNAALAYVRGAAAERLEFLSLGLAHFVRGLNADTAEAVLAQLEGDAVDPATQSLADAVTASDVMDACMDALRGKAAKKPMPSALKKKGAAKAGGRKKARFEGADSDDGSADGGGAAAAADAPRPKAKVPATKANVNKLISGGGGWMKRRKAAEEEEEEGDADEIEDSDDDLPTIKRPGAKAATPKPAPTPGRQTRTSQRAAAHTTASPAAAPSIDLTGDDSGGDDSGSDAEVVAPPTLAPRSAPPRTAAAGGVSPANRSAGGTAALSPAGARSAPHGQANSLLASDTPSRSQPNSLAASPSEVRGVGSLAASPSQSRGRQQGNSLLVTESETDGSVPRPSAGARTGAARPELEALLEADEADGTGVAQDVDMAGSEDEGEEAGATAGAGAGVGGESAGWDSMPQRVHLPTNLFDTEEPDGAGRSQGQEEDVEMEDAEGGSGDEDNGDGEGEGGDGSGGDASDYDSEPEETTRIQRRRRF